MNVTTKTTEERKRTDRRQRIKTVPLHDEIIHGAFASPDSAGTARAKRRLEASGNIVANMMAGQIQEPRSRNGAMEFDPRIDLSPEVARLERKWGHLFN